ncbi:MAG: hypothetical protein P1Q69_20345, partial [Candidatus Thorarchaeota archaeon]|nr:hypothetical protein [Candidatus Thorarchaeota archaeon]
MKYAWNYREGGNMTDYVDSSRWAACTRLGISRSQGQTIPTDIGRMMPADLDEFSPVYALDTVKLDTLDRKYIDYAGYGGGTTSFANPITFLADSSGGGVVSYGLSVPITYDHVMSNSSLTGVFMQMIASRNSLNLWGAMPEKDAISDTRIGVTRWDQIQDISQQGWMEEVFENDGELDVYIEDSVSDTDGADWAQDPYGATDVFSLDDTLRLRQPTQDMSGWDDDISTMFESAVLRFPQVRASFIEIDINTAELDFNQGPLYLSVQLVLGEWTYWVNRTIDEDDITIRVDIDELLGQSEEDFASTSMKRPVLEDFDSAYEFALVMQSVGACTYDTERRFATNEGKSRIFDSTKDDAVQTPLLVTTIFQDNPSNIASGDVLSMMENLLYFDYDYLRMSIDNDYVMDYEMLWNEQEVNHAVMKPIMITVGVGMLALGGLQLATGGALTGIPTMLFGLDMVTSNTIGHSVLDDALKFFLLGSMVLNNRTGTRKAGYILSEGFSFFQFTSDHLVNLLLTQMTFMLVGGALTGGAGLRGFLRGAATKEGAAGNFLLGAAERYAGQAASFRGLLTFAAWTSGVS